MQRKLCRRGRQFKIVFTVEDAGEDSIVRIKKLPEVIPAKLGAGEFPPVIEWIDVGIAANGVGQQFLLPIGCTLAELGQEIHPMILGEDEAALVSDSLGQHGTQICTFESQHGDLHCLRKMLPARKAGSWTGKEWCWATDQCRIGLRPSDRISTWICRQCPSSIRCSSVSPSMSKYTSSTRWMSSSAWRNSTA